MNNTKYMPPTVTRNIYIDVIKGISILLVVFGHCIQYGSGELYLANDLFFYNPIFKCIYSFHMPIFMLISGYLFYDSINKYNTFDLVSRKIVSLVVPIFTWNLMLEILETFYKTIEGNRFIVGDFIKGFLKALLLKLWFLWAILLCSLIVILIKHYLHDQILCYFVLGLILMFLPEKLNSQLYIFMYPYFVVGYFFNKNKMWKRFKFKIETLSSIVLFSSVVFTYILLLRQYRYDSYIYTSGIYVLNGNVVQQIGIDLFRWIIGFVGSICILIIIKFSIFITKSKVGIWAFISKLGSMSLGIYIISNYIFELVFSRFLNNLCFDYKILIVETILVTGISGSLTFLFSRNSKTNFWLLGGNVYKKTLRSS